MRARLGFLTIVAILATDRPGPLTAQQGLAGLAARCVAAGAPATRCTELAVTSRALQGHVGLLAGLGSEVPGSAGTLGRRLGTTPRFALSLRGAVADVGVPDLADPAEEPSRETTFVVPALHAGLAVGLFDGFYLAPTVGGFLSVDLLARASFLFFPVGQGFDGRTTSVSIGARVGLVRESFTLPGVAVSLTRRSVGDLLLGSASESGGGEVGVDPTVTSVRLTVGKDLFAVGLLAGLGWDRYGGSAVLRAAHPDGGVVEARSSDMTHGRTLAFAGAALNFLILQINAELGYAGGFDPVAGYTQAPFDPTAGTVFASLAFRLTI